MPAVLIEVPGYDEDAPDHAPDALSRLNLPMTSKNASRLLYLAFGLFIVASMTYYVMQTIAPFQELMHRSEHARMPFQVDDDLLTINNLQGEALAAGLKPGDRLREVRGEPYRGFQTMVAMRGGGDKFVHAGAPLDVVVRRADGSEQIGALVALIGGLARA